MDKVIVIVTGPARNGTSYLSKLLYSIPYVFSGFETGILLDHDYRECIPWCEWIHYGGHNWGVPKHIDFNDPKLSFNDKFQLLFDNKGLETDHQFQKLIFNSKYLVDKTPKYIEGHLEFVRKHSNNIPILITIKSLREDYFSHIIKKYHYESDTPIENYLLRIKDILKSLKWIKTEKPKNVYLFKYSDIVKPDFGNKLKSILPNKLDMKNDISYENFLKKIDTSAPEDYSYKNWKKIPLPEDLELPLCIKELEETYDTMIGEIKHIFPADC